MNETTIQKQIMKIIGGRNDTRVFRNNVGAGVVGNISHSDEAAGLFAISNGRRIRFGLHVGSSDLIGIHTVTITPEMVGRKVGVFLSIETKSTTGPKREEQINWVNQIRRMGGIAGFAKSLDQVIALLKPKL